MKHERLSGPSSVRLGLQHRVQVHLLPEDLSHVKDDGKEWREEEEGVGESKRELAKRVECSLRFIVGIGCVSSIICDEEGMKREERRIGVGMGEGGKGEMEWEAEAVGGMKISLLVNDSQVEEGELSVRIVDGRLNLTKMESNRCRTIGKKGNGPGQFNNPRGVVLDPQTGHLVVSEFNNHRIQVIGDDGSHIRFIGNGKGQQDGQFRYPWGLALSNEGDLFVCDHNNQRIERFKMETGEWIGKFAVQSNPRCIALGPTGDELFVSLNSHKIGKYSMDGELIGWIGSGNGSADGQLNYPTGLAFNSRGDVLVGDSCNRIISVFEGNTGELMTKCGEFGNGSLHLVIDSFDRIIVSDSGNNRLELFDGGFGWIGKFGSKGNQVGQFDCPMGGCKDEINNRLIVCDTGNHRLEIMEVRME